MRLRICKWSEYQHYKDRNPPWIKLHYSMLSSRTWVTLDDASRVLAIASMLIASKEDGEFEADPEYFKRVAYLNTKPDWQHLIKSGFCEAVQADASTMQADARPEERQSRGETEADSCGEAVPTSPPEPAAGEVFVKGNGPYTIDDDEVGMWFPVVGGKDARGWPLTKAHAKQLRASFKAKFPDAEVMRLEFEKARSWLINNPQRRKTPGGMPAFLNNWIGKTR